MELIALLLLLLEGVVVIDFELELITGCGFTVCNNGFTVVAMLLFVPLVGALASALLVGALVLMIGLELEFGIMPNGLLLLLNPGLSW
jgi:hypothetical protein